MPKTATPEFQVRLSDAVTGEPKGETRAQLSARAQHELMQIRAAARPTPPWEDLREYQVNRGSYERGLHDTRNGWVPDPARRVAPNWKKLRMSVQPGSVVNIYYDADGKLLDPNTFSAEVGPFKVRWLTHPKCGQVEDIAPELYITLRGARGECSKAEPVPDDEPLAPPAVPPNMPSDFTKSRKLAAKRLKKDPDDLTFAEVAEFFRNLPPRVLNLFRNTTGDCLP